jgi:hypothetical protein
LIGCRCEAAVFGVANEEHVGKLLLNHCLTAVSRTIVDHDDLAEPGVDIVLKALETTSQELAGIPVDDDYRDFGACTLGVNRRIGGGHYCHLGTLVRQTVRNIADLNAGCTFTGKALAPPASLIRVDIEGGSQIKN